MPADAASDSGGGTGHHRVGVLAEVPRLLVELGFEPNRIIKSAGISPIALRNPENAMPLSAACRLLHVAATATNCPHFGALVGRRGGTGSLGLVGRLMRSAPTLGEAILDLCVNQHRYTRGAVTYLVLQRDMALWGYAIQQPHFAGATQVCEAAAAIGCAILRELAGLPPDDILLRRAKPADGASHARIFGKVPRFEAEQYALVLRKEHLSLPLATSDRELRRILQRQVSAYWALAQPNASDRVRRILTAHVLSQGASAAAVASELRMTERTMNRRLEAEGTTFRDLLNEARYDASRQLIGATNLPLTDIALALGYATPSAFTRAFSRWSGDAPSAWRRARDMPGFGDVSAA